MVADHVDRVKRDSRLSIDLLRTPPVVLRNVVGSFLRGDWTSKRGTLD